MLRAKISASMMCADIGRLNETLDAFAEAGVDYLHIDVMDGAFAPNIMLGTDYVKQLRRLTEIPLDIHLMVERPEDKIAWFEPRPGDIVSVHYESTPHAHRALCKVRETGAKPMIAYNPASDFSGVEYLLDVADAVLVMTVNPGYAGQALIKSTLSKINCLRERLDASDYGHIEIEVDGNVSFVNAKRMREAGANIFVAGSSSVFTPGLSLRDAINKLSYSIN